MVWSISVWVIGAYFFEENNRNVTINSDRYVNMLENFLAEELCRLQKNNVWLQQDGTTAYTARQTRDVLKRTLPGRLVSKYGDITWPPRSPDLTAADFFVGLS